MKKIALLLIIPILLGSCLKNDEDKFGESAADRMDARITEALNVLSGASNGWVMEYFPEKNRIYGGYTIFVKFTKDEVTASSEIFSPEVIATSLYSIKADNGPVLRFDTYNDVLHFFSDPSVGADQGIGTKDGGLNGDQEFTVMETRADYVLLKGKKTGNYATLTPLPADANWETELVKYQNAAKDMDFPTYRYVDSDGGVDLPIKTQARVNNFTSRVFTITYPTVNKEGKDIEVTVAAPYVYTQTGIRFERPVKIYDKSVSEMIFTDGYYFADKAGSKIAIMTPEPVRSDMTIAIAADASKLTYNKAVTNMTPSSKTEYYYTMLYEKGAYDGQSDKTIIKNIIANINAAFVGSTPQAILDNICSKGDVAKTWNDLLNQTNYVVAAFGCAPSKEGTSVVATTDIFRYELTTPDVPASTSADYRAWLGDWTVVSQTSLATGSPVTLNVKIRAKVADQTFNVIGWTTSVLTNPVVGTFTAAKTIQIKDNQLIASESDSGGDCRYVPYSHRSDTGGYTILSGGWDTAITLALNSNKTSATVSMPTLQNGPAMTLKVITFEFFYFTKDGKIYNYNSGPGYTDNNHPIPPYTMTKATPANAPQHTKSSGFIYTPGVNAAQMGKIKESSELSTTLFE